MRFKDKIVVVVGGNSGIGRASSVAFAREGAHVVTTGRNAATLAETAAEMDGAIEAVQVDITDLPAMQAVIERVGKKHGRIDVLFVNAGIGAFVPLEDATPEFFDEMIGVNLKGPYFTVQYALPYLVEGSSVILTSSIGHCKGIPGNSAYAASKAGLRALARNFGVELVGRGIRVNSFSPGPIETPLLGRSGMSEAEQDAMRDMIIDAVPMKRMGSAEEAADTVLFLASKDSSFVTGIDLIVDGGLVSF